MTTNSSSSSSKSCSMRASNATLPNMALFTPNMRQQTPTMEIRETTPCRPLNLLRGNEVFWRHLQTFGVKVCFTNLNHYRSFQYQSAICHLQCDFFVGTELQMELQTNSSSASAIRCLQQSAGIRCCWTGLSVRAATS